MTEKIRDTEKERFAQATGNCDAWESIDALVSICDEDGFWSEEFLASATLQAKKSHVRRLIKSLPGEADLPAWASITVAGPDGKTVQVYKQEALFDVGDYKQVVKYHKDRAAYHGSKARAYAKRCKQRFNVQIRIDFSE